MRKILLYMCFLIFFVSCATFKNAEGDNKLKEVQLYKIDGIYNNLPVKKTGFYVRSLTDVFDRDISMFNFKKKGKYDNRSLSIKLRTINAKRLNVKIYEDINLLYDKDVRVKIKNDGFLYLKERRFMIDGLPLVFGGWNIQKSRLAIDQNNNLNVQSNYFFCNGILIVMSDMKTLHYNLTFEKQH